MDSPLEALVLNSCGGINLGFLLRSFWSWLAVVAAALSFWRIRTAKPNLLGSDSDHPVPAHHHPEKPEEEAESSPQPETQEQYSEQKQIATTSGEWEEEMHVEMVTKGNKYKACYDYQMKEGDQGDHWQMVVEQWGRKNWKEVELQQVQVGMNNVSTVGMMREMGWYRYQDLMVLDGSVVRLWDNGGFCTRRR